MLLLIHPHAYTLQRVPDATWRRRADAHSQRMRALLAPGFVGDAAPVLTRNGTPSERVRGSMDGWRALSTSHPVYNFLEEYYHIRGAKGTRRLARFTAGLRLRRVGRAGWAEQGGPSRVGQSSVGGFTTRACQHRGLHAPLGRSIGPP